VRRSRHAKTDVLLLAASQFLTLNVPNAKTFKAVIVLPVNSTTPEVLAGGCSSTCCSTPLVNIESPLVNIESAVCSCPCTLIWTSIGTPEECRMNVNNDSCVLLLLLLCCCPLYWQSTPSSAQALQECCCCCRPITGASHSAHTMPASCCCWSASCCRSRQQCPCFSPERHRS